MKNKERESVDLEVFIPISAIIGGIIIFITIIICDTICDINSAKAKNVINKVEQSRTYHNDK